MADEDILHLDTTRDGVAVVTLNRPDIHNAMSGPLVEALDDTFETLRGADGVRVVLLEAAGKSFSAGADLNAMKAAAHFDPKQNEEDALIFAHMLKKLKELPQATIAVVQGPAVGGGLGLVAACDMAIASKDAWFSLSEVKLGIIPAMISPYVVEAIGPRNARRYFLTGERISAEEAYRTGLIHALADDRQGLSALSEQLVTALFQTAPGAVHAAKELIDLVAFKDIDNHLVHETAKLIAERRASDEGKEGISAFLEKRKPSWVVE